MGAKVFGIKRLIGRGKWIPAFFCFMVLLIIGFIDYSIGYRISLLVFYILPVCFATLRVGPAFATVLAVLAILISKGGDLLAGMPYPGSSILLWNGALTLFLFTIVICILHLLSRHTTGLEIAVENRTRDLLDEMSERRRLEREVVELSEREQRRFGQELHDLVCQELAGIAIDTHLLTQNLLAVELGEAERSREIALKVDRALTKARSIARGFFTAGFDSAGLAEALRETARQTEETRHISCVIHWQENLVIADEDTVTQLFRIAQEAIRNAVQHAAASRIEVRCACKEKMFQLVIEDNGIGFSPSSRKGKGLGLSIMAYRAGLIGGEFKVEHPVGGGTRLVCLVPSGKLIGPVTASGG